ncbi:MAG: LmeA family phospholipid-binding protein [Rhodoglobus sp.]
MAEPIIPRVPAEPADAADTLVIESPVEPAKKSRRWLLWIILCGVVFILLVVAAVAEIAARNYAQAQVRSKIITVLALDPDSEVGVNLGGGIFLWQAARGHIDNVSVQVPRLSLGEITGEAEIVATQVPLDSSTPLKTLDIDVTVTEKNVQQLSGFLSGTDLTSVELNEGMIRISGEFDFVFSTIPVAVDLMPSATTDGISFAPQAVLLGGKKTSVADLSLIPGVQDLAGDLLGSRVVCVASSLPKALRVTDVDVVGSNLVVALNGDGAVLGGSGLSDKGTCPAP